MSLQNTRNANEVIRKLRYAINNQDDHRQLEVIRQAQNIDWAIIDPDTVESYNKLLEKVDPLIFD